MSLFLQPEEKFREQKKNLWRKKQVKASVCSLLLNVLICWLIGGALWHWGCAPKGGAGSSVSHHLEPLTFVQRGWLLMLKTDWRTALLPWVKTFSSPLDKRPVRAVLTRCDVILTSDAVNIDRLRSRLSKSNPPLMAAANQFGSDGNGRLIG